VCVCVCVCVCISTFCNVVAPVERSKAARRWSPGGFLSLMGRGQERAVNSPQQRNVCLLYVEMIHFDAFYALFTYSKDLIVTQQQQSTRSYETNVVYLQRSFIRFLSNLISALNEFRLLIIIR